MSKTAQLGIVLLASVLIYKPAFAGQGTTLPHFQLVQLYDDGERVEEPWIKRRHHRHGPGFGGVEGILIPLLNQGWQDAGDDPSIWQEDGPRRQVRKPPRPRSAARKPQRNTPPRIARPARQTRPIAAVLPSAAYASGEIVFRMKKTSTSEAQAIMSSHGMTPMEIRQSALLDSALVRAKISSSRTVETLLRSLKKDRRILNPQPNYLFTLEAAASGTVQDLASTQYAPAKMNVREAQSIAGDNQVTVAVIDAGIDASHPELAGSIIGGSIPGTAHGTGVAGAIAAHARLMGVAPQVKIMALEAFSGDAATLGHGSTFDILNGLEQAIGAKAQIINLSFAGPNDPLLSEALNAASKQGVVLVAAAGNGGAQSAPLFPAANPAVIAVTATDADNKLYKQASRGNHIAVAAPGVDVLVPGPGNSYQQLSGTSLAAAHVSGVVALILQRQPGLSPSEIRKILIETSEDLGPKGKDNQFGAGLVDAFAAVSEASSAKESAIAGGTLGPTKH